MKPEIAKYAEVSWCVFDILEMRPTWTIQQCENFLSTYGKLIRDAMVIAGWSAIESLLPSEKA